MLFLPIHKFFYKSNSIMMFPYIGVAPFCVGNIDFLAGSSLSIPGMMGELYKEDQRH